MMKRIRPHLFAFTLAAALLAAAVPARAWSGLPDLSGEARCWSPLTSFMDALTAFWQFLAPAAADDVSGDVSAPQDKDGGSGGTTTTPPPPPPPPQDPVDGGGCIDPNGCK
jgi:hypothetical protein